MWCGYLSYLPVYTVCAHDMNAKFNALWAWGGEGQALHILAPLNSGSDYAKVDLFQLHGRRHPLVINDSCVLSPGDELDVIAPPQPSEFISLAPNKMSLVNRKIDPFT